MRAFYQQILIDSKTSRFAAKCPQCGSQHLGRGLPLLCRAPGIPELAQNGQAGRFRQRAYNKRRVSAVQDLAMYFNFCQHCGRWVCDSCFLSEDSQGICKQCENTIKNKEVTGS